MPGTTKEQYLSEISATTDKIITRKYPTPYSFDIRDWGMKNFPGLAADEEKAAKLVGTAWDDADMETFRLAVHASSRALLKIYKQWAEEKKR